MSSPSYQQRLLDELPTELLLLIGIYLPTYCKIFLTQTSRRLRWVFLETLAVEQRRNPAFEDKLKMLLALEKQHPELVYCPDCARLRTIRYDEANHSPSLWRQTVRHRDCSIEYKGTHLYYSYIWDWSFPVSFRKYKSTSVNGYDAWEMHAWGLRISFFEAHAVMHRHNHGQEYGLPIDGLKKKFLFERWLPATDDHSYQCNHWPLEPYCAPEPYMTRLRGRNRSDQSLDHLSPPHRHAKKNLEVTRPYRSAGSRARTNNCPPIRKIIAAKLIRGKVDHAKENLLLHKLWPWHLDHHFDACIIDGELYIKRTHRVTCIIDAHEEMRFRVLKQFHLPICRHIQTRSLGNQCYSAHCGCSVMAPEFSCLGGHTQVQHKALRSCVKCYTDYWVSIDWGRNGRYYVELTTYHRLGPCKTVNERAWQTLCDRYSGSSSPLRIEDCEEYGLGAIYSRWHMAQGDHNNSMDGTIPHWSDPEYDRIYNPWLEGLYDISTTKGLTRAAEEEMKSSWFCGCSHLCTNYIHEPYVLPVRRNRWAPAQILWKEMLDTVHWLMNADNEKDLADRLAQSKYHPGYYSTRPVFSNEENED